MTFNEILPILLNEKGVRRKSWEEDKFIFINGCVYLKNSEGCNPYTPRKDDFLYEDWVSIIILKGKDDE